MASTVEVPVVRVLTAVDRCDRCGAQAYVATQHRDAELLWCIHHARELPADAVIVVDERSKLGDVPTA